MAEIENYRQRTAPVLRSSSVPITPNQYYDPTGDAVMARAAGDLSDTLVKYAFDQMKEERKKEAKTTEAANQDLQSLYRKQQKLGLIKQESDYQNEGLKLLSEAKQGSPEDYYNRVQARLANRTNLLLGEYTNKNDPRRIELEGNLTQINSSLLAKAFSIQEDEMFAKASGTADTAIDQLSNSVSLDPNEFEFSLAQAARVASQVSGVLTTEQSRQLQRGMVGKLIGAKIQAQISIDPDEAFKTLQSRYAVDNLSNPEFETYIARIEQAQKARLEEKKLLEIKKEVGRAIVNGYSNLDPNNKKNVDAVGLWFSESQTHFNKDLTLDMAFKNKDPRVLGQIVDISKSTGIVPPQVVSGVSGMLNAGTDQDQVYAATLLDKLNESSSRSMGSFEKGDIIRGEMIANYARAGVSPANSIKAVNKSLNEITKPIADKRLSEVKALTDATLLETLNTSEFADLFEKSGVSVDGDVVDGGNIPQNIKDGLMLQYRKSYEAYYVLTGDATVSANNAAKDLSKTFGRTYSDGGSNTRWMPYPPEPAYKIGNDSVEQTGTWINEQLKQAVSMYGGLGDEDALSENVVLTPDSVTATEAAKNRPRSYMITIKDPVMGDRLLSDERGVPVRFRPNIDLEIQVRKEEMAKMAEAIKKKTARNMAEAKVMVTRNKILEKYLGKGEVRSLIYNSGDIATVASLPVLVPMKAYDNAKKFVSAMENRTLELQAEIAKTERDNILESAKDLPPELPALTDDLIGTPSTSKKPDKKETSSKKPDKKEAPTEASLADDLVGTPSTSKKPDKKEAPSKKPDKKETPAEAGLAGDLMGAASNIDREIEILRAALKDNDIDETVKNAIIEPRLESLLKQKGKK